MESRQALRARTDTAADYAAAWVIVLALVAVTAVCLTVLAFG